MGPRLSNADGTWELNLACGELPVDSAIRAAGREPNGYFWEAVATFIAPDLRDAVEYDSEANLFSAFAEAEAAPLRRLMDLLTPLTMSPAAIAAVMERAAEQGIDLDRMEEPTVLEDVHRWKDDRYLEDFAPADPADREAIGYYEVGRDGLGKLRDRAESVRHLFVRPGCSDLSDLHEFSSLEVLEIHEADNLEKLRIGRQPNLHTLKINPSGLVRDALSTADVPGLTRVDLYFPPGDLLQEDLPFRPTEINLYRPQGEGPISLDGAWLASVERLDIGGVSQLDCGGIASMRHLRWLLLGAIDRVVTVDALNQLSRPLEFVAFDACGQVDDRRALLALTADHIRVSGWSKPIKRTHLDSLPDDVRARWIFQP